MSPVLGITVNKWNIKIYTISKQGEFNQPEFYTAVKNTLTQWLSLKNSFNSANDEIGFLIPHSGGEGSLSIVNWWVGQNMLNTTIYFSEINSPNNFKKNSGDGLAPCI